MDETLSDTLAIPVSRSNTQIADSYLSAYQAKDPSKALLAPDVSLQYPLSPSKIVGRHQVLDYMRSVMPAFDSLEVQHHIAQGEFVATMWIARTVWGVMPACTVFRIVGGLITEIHSYFDPRPIVQRD